jgi:tetratricopeptide (TPR) repeat protein
MLAAIQRQQGDTRRALDTLEKLATLAKRTGDRAGEAEATLTQYEIYRDTGDKAKAKAALTQALRGALNARQIAKTSSEQARSERILAHVLEHFGAAQGARRATDRAYEASRSDSRQLTATLLDAARRALILGDLPAARKAVHEGMEAGLGNEDLVYVALWLRLVEIRQGVPSDGTVEEALANIEENSGWPAKLAAWARGKLSDGKLVSAARSRVQKTEAEFYVAMSKLQKPAQALPKLEEVAGSQAIELVEVAIARDLVARHKGSVDVSLPTGVHVP